MKRFVVLGLTAALVVGLMGPADAKKKKPKPPKTTVPVSVDQKYFLRSDNDCDGPRALSITDGVDGECHFFDSGVIYEALTEAGLLTVEDLAHEWVAADGLPLALDATRPITGEISTSSLACATADVCSPAGVGAGSAKLVVVVLAEIAGEEKELGRFEESFQVVPGGAHTSKVSVQPDAALNLSQVTAFRILTWLHGAAVGHGQIELDDPASFVTVPNWK